MDSKELIKQFVKNVKEKNYYNAKENLQKIIQTKLEDRIKQSAETQSMNGF